MNKFKIKVLDYSMRENKIKNHVKKIIKKPFYYILDIMIYTKKSQIYVKPMENSFTDKYDIFNNSSSNLLKYLAYFCSQKHDKRINLIIEYFEEERIELYKKYVEICKENNIYIRFIKTPIYEQNIFKKSIIKYRNYIKQLNSKYWMIESGGYHIAHIKNNHIEINFNYFISCKNDLVENENFRWKDVDYTITTALLPSQILSASTGAKLDNCVITGFPRNDSLNNNKNKEKIKKWIINKIGHFPKTIFLYVPTFRDYDKEHANEELMGYKMDCLDELLKKNDAILIYKLHPLCKIEKIDKYKNVISYEKSYDFSLYDLMSIVDCFIGDYSSATFDYLLRNKPIIYNLYDLEKYKDVRGLSYDPFELFCCGPIVKNGLEMETELLNVINKKDSYKKERETIQKIIYKNIDFNSTERVNDFVMELLYGDKNDQ